MKYVFGTEVRVQVEFELHEKVSISHGDCCEGYCHTGNDNMWPGRTLQTLRRKMCPLYSGYRNRERWRHHSPTKGR